MNALRAKMARRGPGRPYLFWVMSSLSPALESFSTILIKFDVELYT